MKSIRILVPAAIIAFAYFPTAQALSGDPELLKLVADARNANLTQIHTWRGRASIDEAFSGRVPGRGATGYHRTAEFAVDRDRNIARWTLATQDSYEAGLPPVPYAQPEVHAALLIGDRFYRYAPTRMKEPGVMTNSLAIFPRKREGVRDWVWDFDPMKFYHMWNGNIGETLTFYYENKNDPRLDRPGNSVERDGDRVTLRVASKDASIVNEYVFDLAQGGNIVEQSNKGPNSESRHSWVFGRVNSVWMPHTYNFYSVNRNSDGSEKDRTTRKVEFSGSEVNAVFLDSEFTPEKIGVEVGTEVTDHVRNGTYHYGDTAITPFSTRTKPKR